MLMLKSDISFTFSMRECMFLAFPTKNFIEGCLDTVVIGHTNGFEEVLVGHPHHSHVLALCSNLYPNGYLYHVPNPPTRTCYTRIHETRLCQLHVLFTSKIQSGSNTCQFICCFFHYQFFTFMNYGIINTLVCK